jgi:hypothetical protein
MELKNIIQDGIQSWLDHSHRRNLRMLERLSGVPYSSLRRLYNGESSPSTESILPLAEVIFDRFKTMEILNTYYPKVTSFFKNTTMPEKLHKANEQIAEALLEPTYFLVWALCTLKGATETELEKLWGRKGINALHELYESDYLIREGQTYRADDQQGVSFSGPAFAKAHIKALLDEYDASNELRGLGALTSYKLWPVSRSTLDELSDAHKEYVEKVSNILDRQTQEGPYLYYCVSFSNVINGKEEA